MLVLASIPKTPPKTPLRLRSLRGHQTYLKDLIFGIILMAIRPLQTASMIRLSSPLAACPFRPDRDFLRVHEAL